MTVQLESAVSAMMHENSNFVVVVNILTPSVHFAFLDCTTCYNVS